MERTRIQSLDVTRLADAMTGFNAFDPIGLKQIDPVGKTSREATGTWSYSIGDTRRLSLGNRDAVSRYLGPGSTEIPIGLVLSYFAARYFTENPKIAAASIFSLMLTSLSALIYFS